MFSELPLGRRLLAVALFVAAMAGVVWFARTLTYEWLPENISAILGFVLLALALAAVIGTRLAARRRSAEYRIDIDVDGRTPPEVRKSRNNRPLRNRRERS